jgi:hypothetical protein
VSRRGPSAPKRRSRVSQTKVLLDLRLAAKRGDRTALSLALDQMRTLANSPRYWEKYFALLSNPLARLVDLLVIKQGDRIAYQKGWKLPKPRAAKPSASKRKEAKAGRRRTVSGLEQPSLFDL